MEKMTPSQTQLYLDLTRNEDIIYDVFETHLENDCSFKYFKDDNPYQVHLDLDYVDDVYVIKYAVCIDDLDEFSYDSGVLSEVIIGSRTLDNVVISGSVDNCNATLKDIILMIKDDIEEKFDDLNRYNDEDYYEDYDTDYEDE